MSLLNRIKESLHDESLKKGTLFTLFSFFSNGTNFLLLLVLANYIFPSDYGYLNLFTTIVMVLTYFKAMSTEGYFAIAFLREGNSGAEKSFSCIVGVSAVFIAILLTFIYEFGEGMSIHLDLPFVLLIIAVIVVVFNLYENLFLDYLRVQDKIKSYGVFACTKALSLFFIAIILVKEFQFGWKGHVYAQLGCAIAFGGFGFVFLVRRVHLVRIDWLYCKKMLLWGIPLIPHFAVNFIRQGFDRYIINYYHGIESVGIFSLALNLTNVIFVIGVGFNQAISVEIFRLLGRMDFSSNEKQLRLKQQRSLLFKTLFLAAVIFSVCCYVIVPVLLPNYVESLKYFPILALYAFLYCVYFLYANYLYFFKRTKSLMYVTFSSSLLHLMLSFVFTRYSLYYTCAIYCASQGLILLGVRYLALKTIQDRLGNDTLV